MMSHIAKLGGRWVCGVCGWHISNQEKPWRDTCPVCPTYAAPQAWKPIPIGDLVEKGLTAIGITKERVEALTRTAGKPGGCGCAGRQKWLNEVGNKVQTDARNALLAAKKFYVGD